jgi:O-antigen/teichoic acid export membrane protein
MTIRRYTAANLLGAVVPMAVTLVTVPLYLRTLGDVRYGVLALVWLVIGYFSFLEMGLGKATSNRIARLRDAPDREREDVFWSAIAVNLVLGAAASGLLWLVGATLLTTVLNVPAELREEAMAALPWIVATLPLALVSSVLNGALEGRNRFAVVNALQVLSTAVFQVVPLAVAYARGPSLAVVIPAAVLSRAVMNVPFLVAAFVHVPLTFRPRVSAANARSLLSYGRWIALSGMISPLLETVDRVLIGVVLGPRAVTHYTLPYQLVTKARIIPGSLGRALFPQFSADDPENADRVALASLTSLLYVLTPLVLVGILLLEPAMRLWIGAELASSTSPLGEVLLLGVWANGLAHIPYFLIQGKGHPGRAARLHALEIAPFLGVLWVALQLWGVYGAAWAWTARALVDAAALYGLSGMCRRNLRVLVTPAVMVSSAVLGAASVADRPWVWRVGVFALFMIVVVAWLRTSGGTQVLAALLSPRRAARPEAVTGS